MKDKIKGLLTRKKLFRFFKIAVIVVLTTIALLSLLGTVAHASGLVDDTVNADGQPVFAIPFWRITSLTSMWTIAGAGFRGTGWTVSVNPYNTGFTVSPTLSGLSVCI